MGPTGAQDEPAGNRQFPKVVKRAMTSRRFALSALVVSLGFLLPLAPPRAMACSCASVPPVVTFEGVAATESTLELPGERAYGFDVQTVIDGTVGTSEIVQISLTSDEGGSSSCGIARRLQRGARYRIQAYAGDLNGKRMLFANLCGGSVQRLAAESNAPDSTSVSSEANGAPIPAPLKGQSRPNRWPFLLGGVVALGVGASIVLRRRRRS